MNHYISVNLSLFSRFKEKKGLPGAVARDLALLLCNNYTVAHLQYKNSVWCFIAFPVDWGSHPETSRVHREDVVYVIYNVSGLRLVQLWAKLWGPKLPGHDITVSDKTPTSVPPSDCVNEE